MRAALTASLAPLTLPSAPMAARVSWKGEEPSAEPSDSPAACDSPNTLRRHGKSQSVSHARPSHSHSPDAGNSPDRSTLRPFAVSPGPPDKAICRQRLILSICRCEWLGFGSLRGGGRRGDHDSRARGTRPAGPQRDGPGPVSPHHDITDRAHAKQHLRHESYVLAPERATLHHGTRPPRRP